PHRRPPRPRRPGRQRTRRSVGPGVLWLVNALKRAPAEAPDQQRSLRQLLGGWGSRLHTLDAYHVYPDRVRSAPWGADGKVAVVCGRESHFFDPQTRRPAGEPVKLSGGVLALT